MLEQDILQLAPRRLSDVDVERLLTSVAASTKVLSGIQTRSTIVGVVGIVIGAALVLGAYFMQLSSIEVNRAFLVMSISGIAFVLSGAVCMVASAKVGPQPFEYSPWDRTDSATSDLAMASLELSREIRECSAFHMAGSVMLAFCPLSPFVADVAVRNWML